MKHIPACAAEGFFFFCFFLLAAWPGATDCGAERPSVLTTPAQAQESTWIVFQDSVYSKLGNIYDFFFYKQLCCCFFYIKWVLLASLPFWQNIFFLHIQNIWTKLYYLLSNINNKIFPVTLYGCFVLKIPRYRGTAFTGQITEDGTSELCSRCWCKDRKKDCL